MSELLETIENGVATLTLNRPEARNAFNSVIFQGMLEALPRLANDENVGCIVVTGAGDAFCAGGDVKGFAASGGLGGTQTFDQSAAMLRQTMEVSRLLHDVAKPTIAALPGAAAGAGLSMALACDLRIASQNAKLTTAFAKVGLSGDHGGAYFLSRLVGTGKARELYYFADVLTAEQAAELGIVNKVVAREALAEETKAWAERLANGPRIALSYMKRNLNLSEEGRLGALLDQETFFMRRSAMTDDHKEAAQAFVEKRAPAFKGR